MAGVLSNADLSTLRTLEEFNSPEEILIALRDVTEVHKQHYMSSGRLHRSISPCTVFISQAGRGLLPYPHCFDLHCFPANPVFASVSSLAKSVLKRKKVPEVDYLDDLESMYYTLVFLSTIYHGPGKPMSANERATKLDHTPSVWLNDGPLSTWSVLEKEVTLLGQGFGYGTVQPFFIPFVFETLFEHLHDVLRTRYVEKMDKLYLGDRVGDGSNSDDVVPMMEESDEEKRNKASEDYDAFMASFDYALQTLQDCRTLEQTGVVPDSISHLFNVELAQPNSSGSFKELSKDTEFAKGSLASIAETSDESDDSSGGYSSLEDSPVEEHDSKGDWIKKGLSCGNVTNNLLRHYVN